MVAPLPELELSCADADATAAARNFSRRLPRLDAGVEAILPAANHHPGVPALQLDATAFYLFGQTHATQAEAGKHLKKAASLRPSMNERESTLLDALFLWHADRYYDAVRAFEAYTLRWPADLFAAKTLEFLYYTLGQQHSGERFRRHFEQMADALPALTDDPSFLSMYAFAHELSDLLDDAQIIAEKSLALETNNPWAHHCLSHVYIRRGNREAALDTMKTFLPVWQNGNRLIYCHNAWHLALVHLDLLDIDGAMGVFRDHIWGVQPETPSEEVDAIALLWRVEMAGGDVSAKTWDDIAGYVEARVDECFMPFLNAHFAYALARAERANALEAMLAAVAKRSARNDEEARRIWAPIGQPVVEACAAFGRGDPARTAELLEPIIDWDVTAIGGSDAQDDLFRQTYFTALRESGRRADARQYFDLLIKGKVLSRLDRHWADGVAAS